MAWMKQVLTSGTLPDKIAALTLLSQEAPIHNLASLDSLVAMVKKKGRREALLSLGMLTVVVVSVDQGFHDHGKSWKFTPFRKVIEKS